jgi:hypothetical protein
MNDGHIRWWALLGALASAALLMPACKFPKEGSDYEGNPNEAQKNELLPNPHEQGEQSGTGGSGFQLQQQVNPEGIGAPGDSAAHADLRISPLGKEEPWPRKTEEGGADKGGERERTPNNAR